MGQIISLQDGVYKYELPPLPRETDILFHDAPKKDQYFKTPHSKDFDRLFARDGGLKKVSRMTEKERIEYITFWRNAWADGFWFMNNGEPTYLTGMHVEHLCINKFKSDHFYYLDAQRERFYFRDMTDKDPLCDGRLWAKGRRVGITTEQITQAIRVLLSGKYNHVGLQSDESKKVKSTLVTPIIDAYVKRPEWMREVYYSNNGRVPREKLELTNSVIKEEENEPLGGTLTGFPTTSKALDGLEFMLSVMDEVSKWVESLPYETYEINKKTIINPGKRGKLDALSTTGDSKEAAAAVRDWHKMIADSNPSVRNENGQTNNGLYRFFVSYINSFELIEKMSGFGMKVKDKYGFVNREMAEEFIWKDINRHPKDSKEYIYALYKQPMELRHALLTPSGQGTFNKLKITNRLDILRDTPNDKKPYVRGRFEYGQDGKVYFEADEYGKWLVAVHPYFSKEKNIDTRNRFKVSNGIFMPPSNPEFGIGYDPIRYRKEDTSSNSLSQACIIVAQKHDYFGSGNANRYAALYLDRPDDPIDANKECIKACKYYGAPCMHERVIETVKTYFTDERCLPFLMKSKKDGLYGIWIDSQGKIVKNALDWMKTRFATPKSEDEVCQYEIMPFEACLTDMDGFDLAHTTKFDVMMAMIELEHCLEQLNFTNMTDKTEDDKIKFMQSIFPKRN